MAKNPLILGINLYHGDASCALLSGGKIISAVAEERLNRTKHSAGFPERSVREVLRIAGADPRDLNGVAIGKNPRAHLFRKLAYVFEHPGIFLHSARRAREGKRALEIRGRITHALEGRLPHRTPFFFFEHHLAHAASAFFGSPFESAWILTLDGFGDFVSILIARGEGTKIQPVFRLFYPHSLGILYQAVTQFIGFPHYGDEGKTMGLAPYGDPSSIPEFSRLYTILPHPPYFHLNAPWFPHTRQGIAVEFATEHPRIPLLYNELWGKTFGPPRSPGDPLTAREENLAASVQKALEEAVFMILKDLFQKWHCPNLCLAGGVALNSVLNGKVPSFTPFSAPYVFPAAGDDGLAVGSAFLAYVEMTGSRPEPVTVPLFGPAYSEDACSKAVRKLLPEERVVRIADPKERNRRIAESLAERKIVGFFSGPMEFGPRALGGRSVLADPRDPGMKDRLNQRIKRRESFRPFAPAILREHVKEWFVTDLESPAMLHVIPFRSEKRALIPAVVHVDGTGRLQTVRKEDHPRFYELLQAFYEKTGIPLLLNTSFNENEPIVCTPEDAIQCFLRTDLDILVLEDLWIERDHPR